MIIPWVVTTCDSYVHLMPEFAIRFNEYVGPYKIDLLCFEEPKKLPNNFNVISLGKQENYGKIYTDPIIPYFDHLAKKHKYFFYLLEDYYISKPMKHESVTEVFEYCKKNNIEIDKIDLSENVSSHEHDEIEGTHILKAKNNAKMRCSFQAACWRINYFRKLLKPNLDIWACERTGAKTAKGDGANIFGFANEFIPLEYFNEYQAGEKRQRGRKSQRRKKRYREYITKSLVKKILRTRSPQERLNCLMGDNLYKVDTILYELD